MTACARLDPDAPGNGVPKSPFRPGLALTRRGWDTVPVPVLRILTVCTGNVCRSPAAAVMLRRSLALVGVGDQVEVQSAGTSWESDGNPMDERTAVALEHAGYQRPFEHNARVVHQSEMSRWDLVLPMTREHAEAMRRKVDQIPEGEPHPEVYLWRQFDPAAPANAREEDLGVADPWYEGQKAFDRTILHMERSLPSLVLYVRTMLRDRSAAVTD